MGRVITNDWAIPLAPVFECDSFQRLTDFLAYQKSQKITIFPPADQIFRAFELSRFADTKVVIIGQDPYHRDHQAHGLSFSVPDGVNIPPSLRNIYQELSSDLDIEPNESGDLSRWASQGVLLLNSALTVEKNAPGSHAKSGWIDFTDAVIAILSQQKHHLVFLLWGAYAQQKASLIDPSQHLVLTVAHPSPFSAHKGFFGCRHFSKTNAYLKMHQQTPIHW